MVEEKIEEVRVVLELLSPKSHFIKNILVKERYCRVGAF